MDFQPWLSLVASYGQSCLAQRGKVITMSFICASNIQGATIPGQPIFHATTVVLATTRWNCWFVGMWILTLLEVTHDPTRNPRQTTFPRKDTHKKNNSLSVETEFLGCLGHPSLMWSSACTLAWNSSPFKPCERWQPRSRLYTCQQLFSEGSSKVAIILKLERSCSDAFAILCGGNFRTELEGSSKDRLLRVSSLVKVKLTDSQLLKASQDTLQLFWHVDMLQDIWHTPSTSLYHRSWASTLPSAFCTLKASVSRTGAGASLSRDVSSHFFLASMRSALAVDHPANCFIWDTEK